MPLPNLPEGIETKCNQILADIQAQLPALQSAYKNDNRTTTETINGQTVTVTLPPRGRYWQGLRTHATIPANGNKVAPDKTRKASDVDKNWSEMGITLPAGMECAVAIHEYLGPAGAGYTLIGRIILAGQEYVRTINVEGPETWRSHDWAIVTGG